jgi:hypothetical protein
LADEVFIAHAAAESKTLAFCEELLKRKKPVLTIIPGRPTGIGARCDPRH